MHNDFHDVFAKMDEPSAQEASIEILDLAVEVRLLQQELEDVDELRRLAVDAASPEQAVYTTT